MSTRRWPSMSDETLRSICDAVEAQGGDREDAEDLLDTWERVHADAGPRVDAIRREAANSRCCCADGGATASDGRCVRCHGVTREPDR